MGSPDDLHLNEWALSGDWTIDSENVVLKEPGGSIADHVPGAPRRGVLLYLRITEMDDWVVVEVARSEPEAELLCSVLRDAGIDCVPRLTNSGAGAGDGLGTVGAHDILVRPQDAEDAREFLREPG